MSQKIRKLVIPVAGLGTRFLPATKAQPKEMLPVVDKPVIQYLVEDAVSAGIEEIIFVTSSQKSAIENHFDRSIRFEEYLKKMGKYDKIEPLVNLLKKVKFFYTRQPEPLGNGHALLCARAFMGDEPFAFSDGDSIIDARVPVVKQMIKVFNELQAPVIGVQKISDKKEMTKYGNVYAKKLKIERLKDSKIDKKIYQIEKFVEKPAISKVSPEGLIIGGMRYIFTKDIWPILASQGKGRGGEIWVADAANILAKQAPFYAYEYEGKYFDTGDKLALLKTTIHFAKKEKLL
jgi:UTP--glucose-1-phosphate uridylyltransferase